jgi:hypothetical protein
MTNQAGIDALTWMKKLYKDDKVFQYTSNWSDAKDMFVDGECAMFSFYVYAAVSEIGTKVDFDYGFVPFPKGPAMSNYVSSIYDTSVYVIPKTIDNPTNTAIIYNEIANITSSVNTIYERKLQDCGLDSDGIEVYRFLKKNAVMDFSGVTGIDTYSGKIDATVFQDSKEPKTEIEKIRTACQKLMDDYYSQIK